MKFGPNVNFFMLTGARGSGKSHVCAVYKNRAFVLDLDKVADWSSRDAALVDASNQVKPVIVKISSGATEIINKHVDLKWNVFLLKDDSSAPRDDASHQIFLAETASLSKAAGVVSFREVSSRNCEIELEANFRQNGPEEPAPGTKIFYAYEIAEVAPDGTILAIHYVGKGHDTVSGGYSRRRAQEEPYGDNSSLRLRKLKVLARGNSWIVRYSDAASELEAFRLEEQLYALHSSTGQPLLNKRPGGGTGWTTLQETRRKMSESAKRRTSDPEWRRQHSEKLRGRKMNWTPEVAARRAANISASKRGSKQTPEHAANRSASRKRNGKKLSEEQRKWLSNFHKTRPRGPRPLHLREEEWHTLRILRDQVEAPYPTEHRDQLVQVTPEEKQALLQKRKAATRSASRVVVLDEFEWSRIQQLRGTSESFNSMGIALTPAERVEVRKVRHYINRGLPVPALRPYRPRRTCSAA